MKKIINISGSSFTLVVANGQRDGEWGGGDPSRDA